MSARLEPIVLPPGHPLVKQPDPPPVALCSRHMTPLVCRDCHPAPQPMPDRPAALYVSVEEAGKLTGLGFTTLRKALGEGLPSVVVGRRRLIKVAELELWMDAHGDGGWR